MISATPSRAQRAGGAHSSGPQPLFPKPTIKFGGHGGGGRVRIGQDDLSGLVQP